MQSFTFQHENAESARKVKTEAFKFAILKFGLLRRVGNMYQTCIADLADLKQSASEGQRWTFWT